MDAFLSLTTCSKKNKALWKLERVLLKRLLYRHSNMGDSSDSDAEEDSMLREALDSETRGLYYFQKSSFL